MCSSDLTVCAARYNSNKKKRESSNDDDAKDIASSFYFSHQKEESSAAAAGEQNADVDGDVLVRVKRANVVELPLWMSEVPLQFVQRV